MSTPTTRRYARTMAEAFPRDPRHAYPVEHYRQQRFDRVAGVLLAVVIGISLAVLLVHWAAQ